METTNANTEQQTPAVSIIVPLYNVGEFVGECFAALHAQTFRDFEVIVVDDGSTDDSAEQARAAAKGDGRFRFFAQENAGPSAARNRGMDEARGIYLMFLDPDDYYLPETLERLHATAQANDLDYLDFTAHTFYESRKARAARDESYYEHRRDIPGVMTGPELFERYQCNVEYHCSLCFHFFKRDLLEESEGRPRLRLREELRVHEDELFSPLLIARATRAMFLNEPFYQRRMGDESAMTSGRGMRNVRSMFTVTQTLYAWLQENAERFDDSYIGAMAQRISELRAIAAADAADVEIDELIAYEQTLAARDRVDYELFVVQGMAQHLEFFESTTYRVGKAMLAAPQFLRSRIANR